MTGTITVRSFLLRDIAFSKTPVGAYIVNKAKQKNKAAHRNNRIALLSILLLVVVRSYYSNIELFMLRDANPTTFNFYSSLLVLFALMFHHGSRTQKAKAHRAKNPNYFVYSWRIMRTFMWPLLFIGLTYAINLSDLALPTSLAHSSMIFCV